MSANVSADATPFSFPPTSHQPESAPEELVPGVGEERREKKHIPSDTSSSSDSDDTSEGSKYTATVINITNSKNFIVGDPLSYNWQYNNQNISSSENDYATPSNESKPSEELLNSTRELECDDMYIIAENISTQWKKLARFLPPKPVFSDGQLKMFEDNNLRDVEEAIFQMLNTWKQRHPEKANIGELATTLWNIGKGNIAQKLNP